MWCSYWKYRIICGCLVGAVTGNAQGVNSADIWWWQATREELMTGFTEGAVLVRCSIIVTLPKTWILFPVLRKREMTNSELEETANWS